jgi:hypothetical protein
MLGDNHDESLITEQQKSALKVNENEEVNEGKIIKFEQQN